MPRQPGPDLADVPLMTSLRVTPLSAGVVPWMMQWWLGRQYVGAGCIDGRYWRMGTLGRGYKSCLMDTERDLLTCFRSKAPNPRWAASGWNTELIEYQQSNGQSALSVP